MKRPKIPAAVVDHDAQTITFAVTFNWRKEGLHLDHCEGGVLAGELRRAIIAHFRGPEWTQLDSLESVLSWEPLEERLLGSWTGHRPTPLYTPPT